MRAGTLPVWAFAAFALGRWAWQQKSSARQRLYVSLDTASIAEMMETRPADFLAQYPPPVILDEVQYPPGLFSTIKNTVDKHRNQNGQFILAGSQNFTLMENVAESLAGRVAVIPFLGLFGDEWAEHGFVEHNAWIDFLMARWISRPLGWR